jgi:hypothetical protein
MKSAAAILSNRASASSGGGVISPVHEPIAKSRSLKPHALAPMVSCRTIWTSHPFSPFSRPPLSRFFAPVKKTARWTSPSAAMIAFLGLGQKRSLGRSKPLCFLPRISIHSESLRASPSRSSPPSRQYHIILAAYVKPKESPSLI